MGKPWKDSDEQTPNPARLRDGKTRRIAPVFSGSGEKHYPPQSKSL